MCGRRGIGIGHWNVSVFGWRWAKRGLPIQARGQAERAGGVRSDLDAPTPDRAPLGVSSA
ncbi:hypothetical protein D779_3160 [Imhoffiella purpurea]|uniref:Uncharacterized protein n=1 Tax=Imhoffiella purpurea TaxID=1249627 RepID=W9VUC0_9GAMM|nr:hypothetical protein D779_3160 [Imhoffiella purpurea]